MIPAKPRILTINGGSSSIKFALFEAGDSLQRLLAGGIERIGQPDAFLRRAPASMSEISTSASFAFRSGEGVKEGFIRILGELEVAATRLEPRATVHPDAVHEARLLVKRLRALLWFALPAFSNGDGRWAKRQLQTAAHLLSAERDAAVMEMKLGRPLKSLAKAAHNGSSAGKGKAMQPLTDDARKLLRKAITILHGIFKRLALRAYGASHWPDTSVRLIKASSSMAKAGRRALNTRKSVRWHNWRKKAKRLLYLLELVQVVPKQRKRYALARIDRLQERLGEYHDCVIAKASIRHNPPEGLSPQFARESLKALKAQQRRLRRKLGKGFRRLVRRSEE